MNVRLLVFGVGSLGILVGTLAGLSASPVVAALIGTLTAVAVGFIGHTSGTADTDRGSDSTLASVGIFSIAAIVGVFCGIYIRTHDLLSPSPKSPKDMIAALTDAGIAPKVAQDLYIGQLIRNASAPSFPSVPSDKKSLGSSVLFEAGVGRDLSEYAPIFKGSNLNEMLRVFHRQGGNLATLADEIARGPAVESEKIAECRVLYDLTLEESH